MALFNNNERKILLGIGIGVASATLVRGVGSAFRGLGRPALKATVKAGILLFDKGRENLALFKETIEDLSAEARAEIEATRDQSLPGTVPETDSAKEAYGPERVYHA